MTRKNDITAAVELAFSKKLSKTGGKITGNLEVTGTTNFAGASTFGGNVNITGEATVTGKLTMNEVDFKKVPKLGKDPMVVSINGVTPDANGNISLVSVPIGTIVAMSTKTVPAGFLKCDGSAVSRSTYAALYAAIGVTYGEGDGSSTFNLPNTLNRFLMSKNTDTVGTKRDAGLPNITGTFHGNEFDHQNNSGAFSASWAGNTSNEGANSRGYVISFDASRSSSVYGKSSTVQPPSIDVLMCIKY